jgi:hypothetical protein
LKSDQICTNGVHDDNGEAIDFTGFRICRFFAVNRKKCFRNDIAGFFMGNLTQASPEVVVDNSDYSMPLQSGSVTA